MHSTLSVILVVTWHVTQWHVHVHIMTHVHEIETIESINFCS